MRLPLERSSSSLLSDFSSPSSIASPSKSAPSPERKDAQLSNGGRAESCGMEGGRGGGREEGGREERRGRGREGMNE